MLGLAAPSSPDWLARALAHLDEVLIDHAHCEKKAASTAVSLLFRYPDRVAMLPVLSALAREELAHFEQVLALLAKRGIAYGRLKPGPYATELLAVVRPQEPERLVDTLLCLSLIEARSCERFTRLAEVVDDPEVSDLLEDLGPAEARHWRMFHGLAARLIPADVLDERWSRWLALERDLAAGFGVAPTVHG